MEVHETAIIQNIVETHEKRVLHDESLNLTEEEKNFLKRNVFFQLRMLKDSSLSNDFQYIDNVCFEVKNAVEKTIIPELRKQETGIKSEMNLSQKKEIQALQVLYKTFGTQIFDAIYQELVKAELLKDNKKEECSQELINETKNEEL